MTRLRWRSDPVHARRASATVLADLGVQNSRTRVLDVLRQAMATAARNPARTLLTSFATALGVAAVTAIVGLSQTAGAAVTDEFDALRATVVTFTDSGAGASPLTLHAERSLAGLNGVTGTGLNWRVRDGEPQPVRRTLAQDPNSQFTPHLPICAISARGLTTVAATVRQGRAYDVGMEERHLSVAVLGRQAAAQLGISSVQRSPTIYLGSVPVTVIAIIDDTELNGEILTCVNIPTTLAEDLGLLGRREIVTRTAPGAAQLIAAQGPYAVDRLAPGAVHAQAPPDPTQLRTVVAGSLTSLAWTLGLVALAVGVIAIANTTLLTVLSRRREIGLRRAVGAAPRHIAGLILAEAAVIGTVGGIVGVCLGTLTIALGSAVKGWAPILDPALLVIAPAAGTVAGLTAGTYPSLKATRITPLEAMER